MVNDIFDDIVDDFQNGMSILQLVNKYHMPYKKIDKYLIDNKYKVVKHNKINDDIRQQIIDKIKNKFILKDIVETLHVGTNVVHQIAQENNLYISKRPPSRSNKNMDFVDNYFSIIDTEQKAYFLGLIYADGNVREHDGGYFLNIELKYEDTYILQLLSSELKCNNTIYERNRVTNMGQGHTSSFTSCNSKQLFDDLSKFGIIPNKSHNYDSFKNIKELVPKCLIKHFLRGLIDGDGSISNRKTCNNQNTVSIYQNSLKFCNDFDDLLKYSMDDYSIFASLIQNRKTGVYHLRYRRINDVKKILEFLYKDSNVYLKRKYKLACLYFVFTEKVE